MKKFEAPGNVHLLKKADAVIQTVHSAVEGRARYKVKDLYRSKCLKDHLEHRLREDRDIISVSASTLTGNILVVYNSGSTSEAIASLIEELVSEYKERPACETSEALGPETGGRQLGAQKGSASRGSGIPSAAGLGRWRSYLPSYVHRQPQQPWHLMEAESALSYWSSSRESGLSSEFAKEYLKKFGRNMVPEAAPRSGLAILVDQFKTLPVALLSAAACVSFVTGGLADAVVIMGVVVINAAIGYVTESEAERTIESLKSLVRPSALVVRDGIPQEIALEEVVPGDLLMLRPGIYVAADSRLVEAHYLNVDESSLTGESMPAIKTHETLDGDDIPLADRVNMVFMGTLITGGQGLAVVVATGRFTQIGRLQALVEQAFSPATPMEKHLARIGNHLVLVACALCGMVFVIGMMRGYDLLHMLKISLTLAVAAVPEGLPTVATTTLALGIRNMRRHNVLIRRLDAVETLGAVQTICIDKTGTVTENKMSVQQAYAGRKRFRLSHGKYVAGTMSVNPPDDPDLMQLMRIAVLCNETQVAVEKGEIVLQGSSTESALIRMAMQAGIDVIETRKRYPRLKTNHRSEDRHFMGTLHESERDGRLVALKGSPLDVLSLCEWQIVNGERIPLTDEDRFVIEVENERMAGEALRVLGFACSIEKDGVDSDLGEGLTWLGLIGMADPIRKGVRRLIGLFHEAGIDTIMITGDQSATAYAIGKQLNLSRGEPVEILESTHLTNIDSDALRSLSQRVHVFARVSPAHKLQIVQALQKAGRVVAMTGDGINDGPALKAADIGIALGHAGTDIAREVADVVLENDDLGTMILAISHGRTIHGNIRKSLHFFLSTNLSEIMVVFLATAAGLGHPLSAMQMLWINLVSDIFPGLALAFEPPEPDVLKRPPRDPQEPIIKQSDYRRMAVESATISLSALSAYGYSLSRYGMGLRSSSVAFQTLTLGQLLHAVSCRSETHTIFDRERRPSNHSLNLALGGTLLLQALTFFVPGLKGLLATSSISLMDGIVIGGCSLLPLMINETTKKISSGENK